jgi:hypothetical protein
MEECSYSVHIAFQSLYVKYAEYYETTVSDEHYSLLSAHSHDFLCQSHIPNCCTLQHPVYTLRNKKAASIFPWLSNYT